MNETSSQSASLQFFLSQNEEKQLHLDLWGDNDMEYLESVVKTNSNDNLSLITILKMKAKFNSSSGDQKDVSEVIRSEWLQSFQEANQITTFPQEVISLLPSSSAVLSDDDALDLPLLDSEEPSILDYRWTNERLKSKELRIDNFMTNQETVNRNPEDEVEEDENIYVPSFVSRRISTFVCSLLIIDFLFIRCLRIPQLPRPRRTWKKRFLLIWKMKRMKESR
jgi:hypothetical protein